MAGEEYRRIVLSFWTDPEVKRPLTRDQKLLFLYFCTSPHSNMTGLYYCPLAFASSETDIPIEEVREYVVGSLSSFLTYDETTEEVFVHALAKHNVGKELTAEGKNKMPDHRIAGVAKLLEAVHSPALLRAFLSRYGDAYHLTIPCSCSREAPSEPLPSPSKAKAVQSSTEQSNNNGAASPPSCCDKAEPPTTARQVLDTVRRVLWAPDGQPPAQWSDKRELSIIKALLERGEKPEDLLRAVHGLRVLQDRGEVDWLAKGTKVTLRAVYHTKNGVRDMLSQALDAHEPGPRLRVQGHNAGQRNIEAKRADFLSAANRLMTGARPTRG